MKDTVAPRLRVGKYVLPYALLLPAMVLILAILIYPIFDTLRLSFYNVKLTSIEQPFIGLDNYRAVLSERLLRVVLKNSFIWTLGSILVQFLLGFGTALILDRSGRLGSIIRGLLLVPWVMPGIVIAFIWRWILSPDWGVLNFTMTRLGLIDSYQPWLARPTSAMISLVIANGWKGFPFWMIMITAGCKAINQEIYDAAAVDGAAGWRMIWYIILPLLKLPLFVTSTLAFIWTFNYFDLVFALTRGGPVDATRTVPLYIYDTAFTAFRMGEASATSVLLLALMSVAIFLYIRLLRIQGGHLS
ncbi:MAG: sugar ABC transporter permease [Firmicutes bacterium]|nr:sugar ABC transporter permease [Bacillota bacterium]